MSLFQQTGVNDAGAVTVTGSVTTSGTATVTGSVKVTDGTNFLPTGDTAGRAIFNKVTNGTNTLLVNSDGSINVTGLATSTLPVVIVNGKMADENGNIVNILTKQITYNPPTVGDQATAVVAATAGKKIRVFALSVSLGINSANTYLRDGSGGTQLSVLFLRTTGGSVPSFYYQDAPINTFLFQTTAGTALVANCSTTTGPVSIQLVYALI